MIRDFPQNVLKENKATGRPSRMLYFDTETKQLETNNEIRHRMKLAWTCYVQKRVVGTPDTVKWLYWNNTELLNQYIQSLCKDKTKLYIFAHNIFFDFQASDFYYYFTKWGWVLDFVYDKGLSYMLKIHQGTKTITALSTTNYYPISLKALGDVVGIPKLKINLKEATEKETITYCRQDVEIIKATMEKWYGFINKHDLGNFAMSKAGQSFKAYRHRFMDIKINIHTDEEIIELERLAYMGGRVECGFIGECQDGPFVGLDINSMYPFVMRNKMFPVRLIDYNENITLDKLRSILQRFLCVAEVDLNTDQAAYAVRYQGQIIFPVGHYTTYLCTPGLDYALDHDHLINIKRIAIYEKANIFTDYVDYFYALKNKYKKDGNDTMVMIVKHFLNNLYGKFAQTAPLIDTEEEITFDGYYREETVCAITGKTEVITKLFNKLYIQWGTKPAKTSFAAIAAHVTEYARLYLWDIISSLGQDRLLYTDTDSIKLRKSDMQYIQHPIDDEKLGALGIETEMERLHIYAPKDYETEKVKVLKGVPANAEKIADNKYRFLHFTKQSTHLRKQITRYFISRPMTKVLKRDYKKGVVLPAGNVIPLTLPLTGQEF